MQLYNTPCLKELHSGEAAQLVNEPHESQYYLQLQGEGCSGAVHRFLKSRFSNSMCVLGRAGLCLTVRA